MYNQIKYLIFSYLKDRNMQKCILYLFFTSEFNRNILYDIFGEKLKLFEYIIKIKNKKRNYFI